MRTPEGVVKKETRDLMHAYKIHPASKAAAFPPDAEGWYFMPASNGYGTAGVHDFVGHHRGRFFSIETKAPGRRGERFRGCSPHQHHQYNAITASGARAFVVDGSEDLAEFEAWLRGGM